MRKELLPSGHRGQDRVVARRNIKVVGRESPFYQCEIRLADFDRQFELLKFIALKLSRIFSKNRDAYQYLDESIKKFPEGKHFTDILDKLGYKNIYFKPLSLGICSIYCGEK